MKERNQYDCRDLFRALVEALEAHGYPTKGLTAALAERWQRHAVSINRYRAGSKRLPVSLIFDLADIMGTLGIPMVVQDSVTCQEKIVGSPKKWLSQLRRKH